MRFFVAALVGLILCGFAVPPAHAQAASAPSLSPANASLFAHTDDTASSYWTNALQIDGADSNPGSGTVVGGVPGVVTSFTWDMPLNPVLAGTVTLDKTKPLHATLFMGGNAAAGQVDVESQLKAGGTAVADGKKTGVQFKPAAATGSYSTIEIDMPLTADTLAAGTEIHWIVTVSGASTATFMGMSEGRGHSKLDLPVTGAAAATAAISTTYGALPAGPAHVALPFAEDNSHRILNWTSELTSAHVSASATLSNGSVDIVILDGAHHVAYSHLFSATGSDAALPSTTAGAWRIYINATNAKGNLTLDIAAPANGTSGSGSTTTSVAPTGTNDKTATSSASVSASASASLSSTSPPTAKASPALGLVLTLGLVGAALVARRR